jgi:4-amino-4-deoxy-L-arabinose transferase-like glycosyltransferase
MVFKHDHGDTVQMASQLVEKGNFLIHAERSTRGPKNSPLPVYLLAPFWALNANPLFLVKVIAFLNVVAVGVTFWIGQRYFSTRAGLIAAACFAVSPWAVYFSRTILRDDMVTFFQVFLIASAYALIVDGRRRAIFWVCIFSGMLAQVYFTGYMSVISVLLLIVLYRPKISRPALLLGLAALVLLYLPYGIYLTSGGWKEMLRLRHDTPAAWIHQIDWLWRVVNLGNFHYAIGETLFYLNAKLGITALLLYPLATLERWIYIAGLGWLAWRIVIPHRENHNLRPVGLLLLFLITLPAIVCLMSPWPCWPRYYAYSYPAQFLVIGWTIDRGLDGFQSLLGSTLSYRISSGLVSLTLAGIILTQTHFTATFFSLLRSSGGADGAYGVAYKHKASLANYLAHTYGPDCYNLAHERDPLYKLRMGREVDILARRLAPKKPCQSPAELYLLEVLHRPLSSIAEEGLKPYQRFGPIILYTRATTNES